MRFKENCWNCGKYLENKCEVKEKISISFGDSMDALKVSEEKTKTCYENWIFHSDYINTAKEKVISKVFQKAYLIYFTHINYFGLQCKKTALNSAFRCLKHIFGADTQKN